MPAEQPVAVNVIFSGLQIVVFDAVITGAVAVQPVPQSVFDLITTGVEATLVPQAFLHVAVYVPAVVTVKLLPVAPVLQVIVPVHPAAIKAADSVVQISVLLDVTVGAAGFPPVVIVTGVEATLVPQAFLHVAV